MKSSASKSVLVTGPNGFVGNALVPKLLSYGFAVKALIRDQRLSKFPDVEYLQVEDLANAPVLDDFLVGVETVIHLAARVHVMDDNHVNPLNQYRRINVDATLSLAKQASMAGVKRFIYVSSVKVNGEFTEYEHQFRADDDPNPKDPYAVSKLEAECQLLKFSKETGMDVVIVRPPLVYGPGVKANFLNLIKLVDKGFPMPFGSLESKRSMVFVGNLVDFIVTVIQAPKAAGQIFLISDGNDISIKDLLRAISGNLDKSIWVFKFSPKLLILFFRLIGRQGLSDRLVKSLRVDISKNEELLGWRPPVSFEDAIKATVLSYKANRGS